MKASVVKTLRVLDIDSECRPDAYLGGDLTTRSLTGIAAQFIGEPVTWCRCVAADGKSFFEQSRLMLSEFSELYAAADIVTGHNVIRHDLPILNAACVYFELPQLGAKRVQDTLLHSPRSGLVYSRSQENLGEMLAILDDKYHMNNHRWKLANTLERVELTRARVTADVHMHIQLRAAMIAREMLKPARVWRP